MSNTDFRQNFIIAEFFVLSSYISLFHITIRR